MPDNDHGYGIGALNPLGDSYDATLESDGRTGVTIFNDPNHAAPTTFICQATMITGSCPSGTPLLTTILYGGGGGLLIQVWINPTTPALENDVVRLNWIALP